MYLKKNNRNDSIDLVVGKGNSEIPLNGWINLNSER